MPDMNEADLMAEFVADAVVAAAHGHVVPARLRSGSVSTAASSAGSSGRPIAFLMDREHLHDLPGSEASRQERPAVERWAWPAGCLEAAGILWFYPLPTRTTA